MDEHEQRKARRQEERAERAVREGRPVVSDAPAVWAHCSKLLAVLIAAPFALAFLICCLTGVIMGLVGIIVSIAASWHWA